MYHDLESLKQLAGVYDQRDTGETHLDEINPRKLAALTESVRRASYNDGLNMIYNWIKVGNIDTAQFKDLMQVNEAKLNESQYGEEVDNLVELVVDLNLSVPVNVSNDINRKLNAVEGQLRKMGYNPRRRKQ